MEKKRVGILRGGENNYETSLERGGELISYILENLSDKYNVIDIFIDKNNIWHLSGKQIQPSDLIHKVDVIWNVAHPSFSNVIQSFSIPCIGSECFSEVINESRSLLEEHMKKVGVKMPRHFIISPYQKDFDGEEYKYILKKSKEVFEKFSSPWIVRSFVDNSNMGPVRDREGSQRPSISNGMGIHIAETFPELEKAIADGVAHGASMLVEELISGKNAFMHTVSNFRDEEIYSFPTGNFSKEEKEKLNLLSKDLHKHFGSSSYLKSNFVLHPKRGIFLTSVEFHPDLKNGSHFHKICESVGTKTHNVIESILNSFL